MFQNLWIGTYGPLAQFPARFPDLTFLNFFLRGFIEEKVYKTPLYTTQALQNLLRETFVQITPEMLRKLKENVIHRTELCEEHQRQHFEQYLK